MKINILSDIFFQNLKGTTTGEKYYEKVTERLFGICLGKPK